MIRLFHIPADGRPAEERPFADLTALRAGPGWVWVDLDGPPPDEVATVAEAFVLDPVAVEDVLDPAHFPKVDDYGTYVFVVLHGLGARGRRLETQELDVFCAADFLITIHRDPSPSVERLLADARLGGPHTSGRPDLMFARLTEIQVRRYLPVVDALEEAIAELEDRAVQGDRTVTGDVHALRRDAVILRRVVGPQRETLGALSRPMSDVVSPAAQTRFASVADHHYRLDESLESARLLLAAIVETHRSAVAETTNEAMKVLTVYTAILLPLTLISGIYGMNFAHLPFADHPAAFVGSLAVMALVTIVQWGYFASRGFIGTGRRRLRRQLGTGLSRLARLPVDLVVAALGMDPEAPSGRGEDREASKS